MNPQSDRPSQGASRGTRRRTEADKPSGVSPQVDNQYGKDSLADSRNEHSFSDFERPERPISNKEPGTLAQDAVEAAKSLLGDVTSQAKELASDVTGELGTSAKAGIERGSDLLRGFAQAMQTAARELDSQSPGAAQRVRRAADQIDTFSDSIRDRSPSDLFSAATDLARRQPTAFITGAVIAGFVLSRFLKSSSPSTSPNSARTPAEASAGPPGSSL